ncbi:MAG: hypothetical protein E7Z84_00710 [Methanosphaera stadtmanae]|nr:hypothetical protein [Methanosphaera stadtmanae]
MDDLQEQLLNRYNIEIHTYSDNTITKISSFLKQVDKITSLKKGSIIQLMDTDYICGSNHLKQAISQAIKSFDEGTNFANDKGLEICVRLSAQKQISEALKLLGIKEKGNITAVFINSSKEQINEVCALMNTKNDDLLEEFDEELIRNVYNIKENVDIVNYLNEKIALLALEN